MITRTLDGWTLETDRIRARTLFNPGGPQNEGGQWDKANAVPRKGNRDGSITELIWKPTGRNLLPFNGTQGGNYMRLLGLEGEFLGGSQAGYNNPDWLGGAHVTGYEDKAEVMPEGLVAYNQNFAMSRPDVTGLQLKIDRTWHLMQRPKYDLIYTATCFEVEYAGYCQYLAERFNFGSYINATQGGRWTHMGLYTRGMHRLTGEVAGDPRSMIRPIVPTKAEGGENITEHIRWPDLPSSWDAFALLGSPTDPDILVVPFWACAADSSLAAAGAAIKAHPNTITDVNPHVYVEAADYGFGWLPKAADGTLQRQLSIAFFLMTSAGNTSVVGGYWPKGLSWMTCYMTYILPPKQTRVTEFQDWMDNFFLGRAG